MKSLLSNLFGYATLIAIMNFCTLQAVTSSSLPGSTPSKLPPLTQHKPPPPAPSAPLPPPPPKPQLPPMEKPFGMPGVVGFHDGKWDGTDYLGHLSKNISVSVEVLKGENTPANVDTTSLENSISELLKNGGIHPKAEVAEGPPLPFLHVLVIVYPIDKDSYVIFSTCRLFEAMDVSRKNFKPAGYWQGITWENQDITLANAEQLPAQAKASVERLIKAFLDRYHLYNDQLNDRGEQAPPR